MINNMIDMIYDGYDGWSLPGLSTVLEEEITSKENLTRQCQRAEAEVMTI